ncbi:MAG: DUF1698 domain-containing protein [Flavobacterium sp.]|nr:MAG: DUF1698 domain-containing protein [Flavobacterium sp.]
MDTKNLVALYESSSKHSNYQVLPSSLANLIPQENLTINSRYENERLAFLKENLDLSGKRILDVGGNTGFFSFESLEAGAKEVVYFEGNAAHSNFVRSAANLLDANVEVFNEYLDFETPLAVPPFDIVLLFNVIHHLGDDFGDKDANLEAAKLKMVDCVNYFRKHTQYLVLQMGYCWKGDRTKLLFESGTKREMLDFLEDALVSNWIIEKIGVAEVSDGKTAYHPLDETNIERSDSMGEFRNRPILILKSKEFSLRP